MKGYSPSIHIVLVDYKLTLYKTVGNKKDLDVEKYDVRKGDEAGPKHVRQENASALARDIGAVEYMQCSVKTHEGVQYILKMAARASLALPHALQT